MIGNTLRNGTGTRGGDRGQSEELLSHAMEDLVWAEMAGSPVIFACGPIAWHGPSITGGRICEGEAGGFPTE